MEPNLLAVGVLTSAGVVYLCIRLGWLRKVATRVAVAVWITAVVMIACLPLCESLPGGFMFAFASGLACALPATWVYHRAAIEWHGYPAESAQPAAAPLPAPDASRYAWVAPQNRPQNWTAAQKVEAGMKRYATYKVVAS